MRRHIVLVGLPGSGKSTVGQLVAQSLQAEFVDIDAIIMRKQGRPMPIIFAEFGEAAFRQLEHREVEAAFGGPPAVIAPGGGWVAQPGALESAQGRAVLVYLKTRPDTATARAGPQGNRPTLMGEDRVTRMRELLREREPFYNKADAHVETDRMSPVQVAVEVAGLARLRAEW